MIPKFEDYYDEFGASLLCPVCGGNYLHHERVEVFERVEDAAEGVHVAVESLGVTVDTSLDGNPSARRDGIKIYYWCELCPARSVLCIAQHKGNTFVDFVVIDEDNDANSEQ